MFFHIHIKYSHNFCALYFSVEFVHFSVKQFFVLQRYLLHYLNHIHIWQVSQQLGCDDTCSIQTWYFMNKQSCDHFKKNPWNSGIWEIGSDTPTTGLTLGYYCVFWQFTVPGHEHSYADYKKTPNFIISSYKVSTQCIFVLRIDPLVRAKIKSHWQAQWALSDARRLILTIMQLPFIIQMFIAPIWSESAALRNECTSSIGFYGFQNNCISTQYIYGWNML